MIFKCDLCNFDTKRKTIIVKHLKTRHIHIIRNYNNGEEIDYEDYYDIMEETK